jgi:hypothetical protein
MQIHVLGWIIEVDREATITAYRQWQLSSQESADHYTLNYLSTFDQLPIEFADILQTLGIDPTKPSEVCEVCENNDGTHLFMGWYHIIAKCIAESNDKMQTRVFPVDELGWNHIAGNCHVKLTEETHLLPKNFPREVLQVNFTVNIPWVMDEPL